MTQRVQLSRRKGWRMPPNTVKVDRTTPFGNPFTIAAAREGGCTTDETARALVVECFRDWLDAPAGPDRRWHGPESDQRRSALLARLSELRGKDLACWCKPGEPCHADVLLEIANRGVA